MKKVLWVLVVLGLAVGSLWAEPDDRELVSISNAYLVLIDAALAGTHPSEIANNRTINFGFYLPQRNERGWGVIVQKDLLRLDEMIGELHDVAVQHHESGRTPRYGLTLPTVGSRQGWRTYLAALIFFYEEVKSGIPLPIEEKAIGSGTK